MGNGHRSQKMKWYALFAALTAAILVGFFCFAVLLKYGISAMMADVGNLAMLVTMFGFSVGAVSFAFLAGRPEATGHQPQHCPQCGMTLHSHSQPETHPSVIEGRALHRDRVDL